MVDWKRELRASIRSADELSDRLDWTEEQRKACQQVESVFPLAIPPYYFSLIDRDNPDDPIAKMCVPSSEELSAGGSPDTSGEASNTVLEGMQHKYGQTALILSSNQCAMYCRHCFRKRFVGMSDQETNKRINDAVSYIVQRREINNALITGGDSLLLPNSIIERYLCELASLDQLDFIRFGSRLPVVLPQRISGDKELLNLLSRYSSKKAIVVVTQFNHPRELTEESVAAIKALLSCGVQVRNQTVLLRGVNDDAEVLSALLAGLTRQGVAPYYIFQCRPVFGAKEHFQVPLSEGIAIVEGAKSRQNGIGKAARYVMSHPRGKIEVVGTLQEGETVFKFHQSRRPSDEARVFLRRLPKDCCWLDDDLMPA